MLFLAFARILNIVIIIADADLDYYLNLITVPVFGLLLEHDRYPCFDYYLKLITVHVLDYYLNLITVPVFGLLIELRGQKGCCKLNFNDVPAEVNLNTIGLDDAYDLLNELNSTVDKKDLRQKISHWLCDTILGSSV